MTPVVLVLCAFGHEMLPPAFCSIYSFERLASAAKVELVLHPERFVPLVNLKVPYSKFWDWLPVLITQRASLEVQKVRCGFLVPQLLLKVQMPIKTYLLLYLQ